MVIRLIRVRYNQKSEVIRTLSVARQAAAGDSGLPLVVAVVCSSCASDVGHLLEGHLLVVLGQRLLVLGLVVHVAAVRVGVAVLRAERVAAFARELAGQRRLLAALPAPVLL